MPKAQPRWRLRAAHPELEGGPLYAEDDSGGYVRDTGWWRFTNPSRPDMEVHITACLGPDGKPAVDGLIVFAPKVTHADLQTLPLQDMAHRALGAQATWEVREDNSPDGQLMALAEIHRPRLSKRMDPSSDEFLLALGDAFRDARAKRRSGTQELAKRLDVQPVTVSKYLRRYRERAVELGWPPLGTEAKSEAAKASPKTRKKQGQESKKGARDGKA